MTKKLFFMLLIALAVLMAGLITGCVSVPEPTPTSTPTPLPPTATITSSPTVTETSAPTLTMTVKPTETPKPSWTPRPTRTPKLTETPWTTPGPDVIYSDCVNRTSFACSIGAMAVFLTEDETISSCDKAEYFLRLYGGEEYTREKMRDTEWLVGAVDAYMDFLGIAAHAVVEPPDITFEIMLELVNENSITMIALQRPEALHAVVVVGMRGEEMVVFDPLLPLNENPFSESDYSHYYDYEIQDAWVWTLTIHKN